MADYNYVAQIGRLTFDPDMRVTPNGKQVVSLKMANNKRTTKDHPESNFFKVEAWGQLAEFAVKYFKKGSRILVTGELDYRTYKDKNGVDRQELVIIASNIHFVESKKDSDGGQQAASQHSTFEELADPNSEELPF